MANVETMEQLYRAFEDGDVASFSEFLDPDVVWVEPDVEEFPYQGVTRGSHAVMSEVLGGIPTIYQTLDFSGDKRWIDGGDVVAVLGEGVATGHTGRTETFRFVHVWTLQGGTIVRFDGFADTHKLRQAITGA